MGLEHVLLGLLRSPASGYELKRHLDQAFSQFWVADLPQIYRTLNRMEGDGLLAVTAEPSERGPARRVYRLTDAGRAALRDWLTARPELPTERIGYLAQTFLLGAHPDDTAALEFMRTLREALQEELRVLQGIAQQWAMDDAGYPDCAARDDFYAQLTLDHGIQTLTTKVAWASRCIRRIETRIAADRPAGG